MRRARVVVIEPPASALHSAPRCVPRFDGAHGYAVDYDYCKGCGICVEECPCGAIEMVPEVT
jgi:Pyruvate/2-oxoacid:ferredoxin oxidoreductase delta subunit